MRSPTTLQEATDNVAAVVSARKHNLLIQQTYCQLFTWGAAEFTGAATTPRPLFHTRSSAITEGSRDALCQLKSFSCCTAVQKKNHIWKDLQKV